MDDQQGAHPVAQQHGADVEETRRLLATIAGLRQQLERVNEECRTSMLTIAEERTRAERAEADNARLRSALEPLQEVFGRWGSGYGFNDDSDEDVELYDCAETGLDCLRAMQEPSQ